MRRLRRIFLGPVRVWGKIRLFNQKVGIMRLGLEIDSSEGFPIGKDPRKATPEELTSWGCVATPPLVAIRSKCIDCCGGSESEVRKCVAVSCALWPFRMRKNPWLEKRVMSEERKVAARKHLQKAREARLSAS